jgi:hypothetical protein
MLCSLRIGRLRGFVSVASRDGATEIRSVNEARRPHFRGVRVAPGTCYRSVEGLGGRGETARVSSSPTPNPDSSDSHQTNHRVGRGRTERLAEVSLVPLVPRSVARARLAKLSVHSVSAASGLEGLTCTYISVLASPPSESCSTCRRSMELSVGLTAGEVPP